jgi:hypothetical protein
VDKVICLILRLLLPVKIKYLITLVYVLLPVSKYEQKFRDLKFRDQVTGHHVIHFRSGTAKTFITCRPGENRFRLQIFNT